MLKLILKDIFGSNKKLVDNAASQEAQSISIKQQCGGKVIWFSADSEGDALASMARDMMDSFSGSSTGVVGINLSKPEDQSLLWEVLAEPIWFVFSPFGGGQDISASRGGRQVNIWEEAGIPFVRVFGDTPAYFPGKHVRRFRNSINCYHDRSHWDFYRRWFADPAYSVLVPPTLLDAIPLEAVDVESKRSGKIIFPKNGNSPRQLIDYWKAALPPHIATALEQLAEESISKEWINREPCLDDRLISFFMQNDMDLSASRPLLCFLVAQLDDYIRRVKSAMIAEALLDLPIIIRGRFWDHIDFKGKRAVHDPDSDFVRTRALIDQAPAIVDMSPNTQHSPHDRVRRAVSRGTAFLSNRLSCFDGVLSTPERFSFEFERTAIRTLVEHYVSCPADAIELGIEQATVLRKLYRPEAFVESISRVVDAAALGCGARPAGTQDFVSFASSWA